MQYVAQEEIARVEDRATKIISAYVDHFFSGFSELKGSYNMRRWLKRIYPRD